MVEQYCEFPKRALTYPASSVLTHSSGPLDFVSSRASLSTLNQPRLSSRELHSSDTRTMVSPLLRGFSGELLMETSRWLLGLHR